MADWSSNCTMTKLQQKAIFTKIQVFFTQWQIQINAHQMYYQIKANYFIKWNYYHYHL
jgi:hypothetical protein